MSWLRKNVDLALLLGVLLAAHGALLVHDGVYWDDWLWWKVMREQRWDMLFASFRESGTLVVVPCMIRAMHALPGPVFGSKVLAFLLIAAAAFEVRWIALATRMVGRGEALLLAMLAATYPAFQTTVLLATDSYLLFYCLFLLAIGLLVRFRDAAPLLRYGTRVAALGLLFVSFGMNSLLVFVYPALLVVFAAEPRNPSTGLATALARFARRHVDLLLVPLLFWLYRSRFLPTSGEYASYNKVKLSAGALVANFAIFAGNSIVRQLDLALGQLVAHPALGVALVIAALTLWPRRPGPLLEGERPLAAKQLALFGLLQLGAGIFPYAAVGLAPLVHGKTTRNALLIGMPMALLFVALGRSVLRGLDRRLTRIGLALYVCVIGGFVLEDCSNLLAWQARWAKDRSIIAHLAKLPEARRYGVFWVDDQMLAPESDRYSFYDWSSMFAEAWHEQGHVGLDRVSYASDFLDREGAAFLTERYNLAGFDRARPQAELTVRPGPMQHGASDFDVAARYVFYRLTASPHMDEFLDRLTQVEVRPAP